MPELVSDAGIRFPVGYSPWYVYEAIVDAGETFPFMDVLVPSGGTFTRLETDDASLAAGYVFALEAIPTALAVPTTIQVAVPGSLVPFVAGGVIEPEGLIKFNFAASIQTVVAAVIGDITLGRIMGRYRNQNTNAQNLRVTADEDIIYILSGVF